MDSIQQAEDYHDAVLFAQTLSAIDPFRVVIWGIGHAGGAVIIAGGDDPSVKGKPTKQGRRKVSLTLGSCYLRHAIYIRRH